MIWGHLNTTYHVENLLKNGLLKWNELFRRHTFIIWMDYISIDFSLLGPVLFGKSKTEKVNEKEREAAKKIADSISPNNAIDHSRHSNDYQTFLSRERVAGYVGLAVYVLFVIWNI